MSSIVESLKVIEPATQESVQRSVGVASKLLAVCQRLTVTCADEYEGAAAVLKNIKTQQKIVKDSAAEFLEPLKTVTDKLKAVFKQPADTLAAAETLAKSKMNTWAQAEDAARREEERRLNAERAAAIALAPVGVTNVDAPAPVTIASTVPKVAGMARPVRWKYRVVDMALVPAAYTLTIVNDEMLASRAVSFGHAEEALRPQLAVPGVEFYPDQGIASGRAR